MSDTESGPITLYRCTECGKLSVSRGYLHGHIEKHQGFGPFNIIPDPRKTANPDALDEKTEVLEVTSYEVVALVPQRMGSVPDSNDRKEERRD